MGPRRAGLLGPVPGVPAVLRGRGSRIGDAAGDDHEAAGDDDSPAPSGDDSGSAGTVAMRRFLRLAVALVFAQLAWQATVVTVSRTVAHAGVVEAATTADGPASEPPP